MLRVLQGEHSVSALARLYPMSVAAVQKHVAVLEAAELVTKRRRGREQLVAGNVGTVREAARLLDRLEALSGGRWHARPVGRLGVVPHRPRGSCRVQIADSALSEQRSG